MSRSLTSGGNGLLFDQRPIELAGFKLAGRSVRAIGTPTGEQWIAAVQFAGAAEEASPYWIGDLLEYADTREDWRAKLDQMLAVTGLARQTIHNRLYIARHTTERSRRLAPSLAHAAQVAPLKEAEQCAWLEKSQTEGYSVRELRREIRASRRRQVLEATAVLEGQYRVIYAAPPWSEMTVGEIAGLPVQVHAAANAVLFLWVPAPRILQAPGPREVLEAWGFDFKTCGVWDRVAHSFGGYLEIRHEFLAIATRGDCQPDQVVNPPTSIYVERQAEPGDKAKGIRRDWIEKMYTTGPYLEIFATQQVEGWDVFGQDVQQWGQQ